MAVLPDRSVLHTSRDGRVWRTTAERDDDARGHDPRLLARRGRPAGHRDRRRLRDQPLGLRLLRAAAEHARRRRADQRRRTRRRSTPFKGHNQLSRIKLTANNTLDLATEQKILQVPADRGICCHAGGEIDFDAAGNLYLSTGDDSNPFESDGYAPIDERLTRNPGLRRPALLRQHERPARQAAAHQASRPTARTRSRPATSSPPARWARGPRSTRWASATRSASRSTTRPAGSILGDYGPDAGGPSATRGPGGQVEFNLIKGPGNYGWPYCHGKNDAYNDFNFATSVSGAKFDCAAPVNNSPRNTGLTNLPPSQPAWIAYDGCNVPEFGCGSESPMGGETYHFDAGEHVADEVPRVLRRQELLLRVRPRLVPPLHRRRAGRARVDRAVHGLVRLQAADQRPVRPRRLVLRPRLRHRQLQRRRELGRLPDRLRPGHAQPDGGRDRGQDDRPRAADRELLRRGVGRPRRHARHLRLGPRRRRRDRLDGREPGVHLRRGRAGTRPRSRSPTAPARPATRP